MPVAEDSDNKKLGQGGDPWGSEADRFVAPGNLMPDVFSWPNDKSMGDRADWFAAPGNLPVTHMPDASDLDDPGLFASPGNPAPQGDNKWSGGG